MSKRKTTLSDLQERVAEELEELRAEYVTSQARKLFEKELETPRTIEDYTLVMPGCNIRDLVVDFPSLNIHSIYEELRSEGVLLDSVHGSKRNTPNPKYSDWFTVRVYNGAGGGGYHGTSITPKLTEKGIDCVRIVLVNRGHQPKRKTLR